MHSPDTVTAMPHGTSLMQQSQFTGKQASYLDTNQCYFDD